MDKEADRRFCSIWVRKLSISATGVYVEIKGQKYNDNEKETTF